MLLAAILLPLVAFGWHYSHIPPVMAVLATAVILIVGLNLDWKRKAAVAAKSGSSDPGGLDSQAARSNGSISPDR